MSLGQHLTYQRPGTVSVDLQTQPSNVMATIYKSDGTVVLNSTAATINAVSTTVSGTPERGDRALNVVSNAGISPPTTLHLTDDPEEILVASVAGTQLNLRRPLQQDHRNAAAVVGTKVSLTVNSATTNSLFWDGRVEWNIDASSTVWTQVEVTKYPLARLATVQDILDLDPAFFMAAEDEVDRERLLDLGHEHVLKYIAKHAPDTRVRVFPGSSEFKTATAMAALYMFYMPQAGEQAKELREVWHNAMESELSAIVAVVKRDANQDDEIAGDEQMSPRVVRIDRS